MDTDKIDERARQMSDSEREAYLVARGWQNVGVGWISPAGAHPRFGGRVLDLTGGGGMYSLSTAIREQLARECPGSAPDERGRHYRGSEPDDSIGRRW
jgi:hypothetical protein